jgi:hypothetical protein
MVGDVMAKLHEGDKVEGMFKVVSSVEVTGQ